MWTLESMTDTPLPTCWSWPHEDGRSHMVAAGAVVEPGTGHSPAVRTLCGEPVQIGVHRVQYGTAYCHDRLATMIAAAFDLLARR
jgi:hypothetical protein